MNNIIILEGENKTGKTTLANYFVDKYKFKVLKCSQPSGDPYIEYMEIIKKLGRMNKKIVVDRFYLGEFVYGPIYRGKSGLTKKQMMNIELKLLSLGVKIIYCHDTVKNIGKRFEEEGEEFATTNKIGRSLKLFDNILASSILPIIKHQMKTKNDLFNINGQLNELAFRQYSRPFKTAIGNTTNPKIILIGRNQENENPLKYNKYKQPFDFGASSNHLFISITKAKIPFNDIMIIDSNSPELNKLKKKPIIKVAIGRNVSNILEEKNIEHITVKSSTYDMRHDNNLHKELKQIYGNKRK